MKNKKYIILALVVSLLLVGSLAFAGYNEDVDCDEEGQFFGRGSSMVEKGYRAFNQDSEVMVELVAKIQVKLDEIFSKLVTDKVLTQTQVDQINAFEFGRGMKIEDALGELDDAQCEAIEVAMEEMHEYKDELRAELVEEGLVGRNFKGSSDETPRGRMSKNLNEAATD